jgi:hypothetical protein
VYNLIRELVKPMAIEGDDNFSWQVVLVDDVMLSTLKNGV